MSFCVTMVRRNNVKQPSLLRDGRKDGNVCAAMGSGILVPIAVVDYGSAWAAVISVLQL
jgi:hypothetical protein